MKGEIIMDCGFNFCDACFAERVKNNGKVECGILNIKKCQGHNNCSSYKTVAQCKAENDKALKRIRKLSQEQQDHIVNKYKIDLYPEYN